MNAGRIIQIRLLLLAAVVGGLAGCSSMKPGQLSAVKVQTDRERAGNVFLLRGFIGIFSTGMDSLGVQIDVTGVEAQVFQDDQWRSLAATLGKRYSAHGDPEPLVLIGHSYGADDVVRIARELDKYDVKVDLLVTLDPVTPPSVTKNVKRVYNLYQSNGFWDSMPWLRGVALQTEREFAGDLQNVDIRVDRRDLLESNTDHFNIEKKGKIHKAVIEQVLAVCIKRDQWLASRRSQPNTPSASASQRRAPAGASRSPAQPVIAGADQNDAARKASDIGQ